jgi:anti-sigma factor RsiW
VTCRISRLTLTAYLDAELGMIRYHLVRLHLRRCERCRSRLSQLKAADALVHLSRESSGPTRGMSGRLPGRLQVELGLGPIHEPAPSTPGDRWRVRIAAAVVLGLLVGAGVLAVSWPAREAGDLVALGMENQAKATALLQNAQLVEYEILRLRMQLLEDNLEPATRSELEEQLTRLAELVASIKADARLCLHGHAEAMAAAGKER